MTITLATLPQASAQEVFTHIKNHLLSQMEKSEKLVALDPCCQPQPICMYRLEELRCAAGCLISDEEYKESFENKSWLNLTKQGLVPSEHRHLVSALQFIHDGNPPEDWAEELKSYADRNDLIY